MRLINSGIGVRGCARVRIHDRNRTKPLPPNNVRSRILRHTPYIIKRIVFVRISVRPTIHDDCSDVSVSFEAACRNRAHDPTRSARGMPHRESQREAYSYNRSVRGGARVAAWG